MDLRANGKAIFAGATTKFQIKKGLSGEKVSAHKANLLGLGKSNAQFKY
jgi:hypothetical protein